MVVEPVFASATAAGAASPVAGRGVVPCAYSTAFHRVRPSTMNTHRVGRRFEALAAEYLLARGWTILARNYRFGRKEIDLIVSCGRTLAFVEVKGRRGDGYGHPLEAITWRKRREISQVARHWIQENGGRWDTIRFDAIAVREVSDGPPTLEHTPDAWRRS